MYPDGSETSRQGWITIPITAVMKPPVLNDIFFGQRFAKSFAGLTTLAAMFVASVAIPSATSEKIKSAGLLKWVMSTTGSQIVWPKMTAVADVTATPMNE